MNRSHTRIPRRHLHRQSGTSLIEVLVAVLILTVGLMSMVALHAASMRYGKIAEFKTTATQLGEDLADRMRANMPGVLNGNYVYKKQWTPNLGVQDVPEISICTATDGTCEAKLAAAVAERDVAEWINQAYPSLPGVGLYMDRPGGSVMDVWIGWLEPAAAAGADADAEKLINSAYACPNDMVGSNKQVRCMRFRFTL
jgi:type IV pilus assembly protein PilV